MTHPVQSEAAVYAVFGGSWGSKSVFKTGTFGHSVTPPHQAVADKAGYQLVLDKGSEQTVKIVIFNKDTIDLTEQVIKEFDRTNK